MRYARESCKKNYILLILDGVFTPAHSFAPPMDVHLAEDECVGQSAILNVWHSVFRIVPRQVQQHYE